jgi:hypothetical protein
MAYVDGGTQRSSPVSDTRTADAGRTAADVAERSAKTPLETAAADRSDKVAQAQTARRQVEQLESMRPSPMQRTELNEARQQATRADRAATDAVTQESRIAHETLSPTMAERYEQDVVAEYRGDANATRLVEQAQAAPKLAADQAADDLVKRQTSEDCSVNLPLVGGINCRQDVNGGAVGKEIAAVAKTDPVRAQEMLDQALAAVPDAGDKREVAKGLTDNLSTEELRNLAATPAGRAMLDSAAKELRNDGSPNEGEIKALSRIDSATKASDLAKDPNFKKLDAATQRQVLDQIAKHETDAAAVDNIVALAKSAGFQTATPATRAGLLKALDQHPGDKIFRQGLEKLAADPNFAKLTPAQQADAIKAFEEVAASEAYKGKEGSWFFNMGAKSVSDADKRKVLDNAINVVTAKGFHDVGPESRKAMLDAFGQHATDAAYTGRLANLVNDAGFMALNDKTKEVDLLKAYGKDEQFAAGVDAVIAKSAYTGLAGADRAKVLDDVTRLTKTDSYKDADKAQRQEMVDAFGDIAIFSATHPDRVSIRNSMDRVLNGDIKLHVYRSAPELGADGQTYYSWGYANDKGIYLNTDPTTRSVGGPGEITDTLVHEASHFINGPTSAGTADRFMDEYRSAVLGQEAKLGRTLTPDEQRRIVDNLVDGNNSAYSHLADLYNSDATFKQVIDDLRVTLDGSASGTSTVAPASVTPEQVRQRLLDAGITSDYLNKVPDLDN